VSVGVDVHELPIGTSPTRKRSAKDGREPILLTLSRAFLRAFHGMDGLFNLTLVVSLGAATGFLRVPMRSCLLMRRVRVILRLKVFGLVWGTFAIPSHEFSKFEGRL
jgi:hypothetical protein